MIRNLKALGLLVVAAFAMTAIGASAAHAQPANFQAGSYTATVRGVQTTENTLSNGIRSVSCATANLTGGLPAASTTITIESSYSNCTGNGNTTATVTTNGCDYTLHVVTKTATDTGTGSVTIMCPPGQAIQVDIWATGKAHNEPKLCRLEVPEQGPVGGIEWHDITPAAPAKKTVLLTLNINTLRVLRTEGTLLNCGPAEKTTATYTGNIEWSAKNGSEVPIDLFIN
jgi:hypothetical protein